MDVTVLKQLVKEIVKKANDLKNKHTSEKNAPVNYACIFAQSKEQYDNLLAVAKKIGSVIEETPTGPLFRISPLNTVAGKLQLLKIRKPDATRPELGDADFTVTNYVEFKKNCLSQKGFKLIARENFEMIELVDLQFNVKVYFSNPPLNEQLRIGQFWHCKSTGSNAGSSIIHSIMKKGVVYITYFVHGTTTDNEQHIATGWSPGELSELGKRESIELRKLIKNRKFDFVFCSDLKRAVDSAKLTFKDRFPIIQDKRLRECNYGDLTGSDSKKVEALILKHINKPFPNGESYKDVEKRVRSFLRDLSKSKRYNGKHVAIVAHRAPQLALEVILNGKSWEQAIKKDWRLKEPKAWQPGWDYRLEG